MGFALGDLDGLGLRIQDIALQCLNLFCSDGFAGGEVRNLNAAIFVGDVSKAGTESDANAVEGNIPSTVSRTSSMESARFQCVRTLWERDFDI